MVKNNIYQGKIVEKSSLDKIYENERNHEESLAVQTEDSQSPCRWIQMNEDKEVQHRRIDYQQIQKRQQRTRSNSLNLNGS